MTATLTPKQSAILDFFRSRVEATGLAPTLREIAAHFGTAHVTEWENVKALLNKGALMRGVKCNARNLYLPDRCPMCGVKHDHSHNQTPAAFDSRVPYVGIDGELLAQRLSPPQGRN